ncbi:hypothetical protein YPPY90_1199, partial [Yersinia pestis PY-90]
MKSNDRLAHWLFE